MSAAKPTVILVTSLPYFQWRGSPIRVGFNLQALAGLGYDVHLVTVPIGEERPLPGVTVHRVGNPFGFKHLPIGPSAKKLFFDVLLLVRAWRLARKLDPVVIHGIEETGALAVMIARATGAKAVVEKHSDPASYRAKPLKNLVMAMYRKVEAWALRRADAIIATGEGLCDQARSVAPGKPIHHIFDIPSSLVDAEPEATARFRETFGQDDEVLALYVGSFATYQGLDLMFEAMPHVLAACPSLRFDVVGGTAEEIADRKAWLTPRNLADRVTFPGKIPPDVLPSALAAADILLSPRSQGVNTPLKLLDYLKAGRPIVATDHPANRRILDESMAVLTDPGPEQFAAGIIDLARDRARRDAMGKIGRALVDGQYNFAHYQQRIAAAYRDARGGEPREQGGDTVSSSTERAATARNNNA